MPKLTNDIFRSVNLMLIISLIDGVKPTRAFEC